MLPILAPLTICISSPIAPGWPIWRAHCSSSHSPTAGRLEIHSGVGADGYPWSLRCVPTLDHGAQLFRINIGADVAPRPGVASLLCHFHNDQLWDLRSLNVRGKLECDAQGWFFRPTAIVPEMSAANPIAMIRTIATLRRRAANYLKQRNLPTPTVPWQQLEAVKNAAIARDHAGK